MKTVFAIGFICFIFMACKGSKETNNSPTPATSNSSDQKVDANENPQVKEVIVEKIVYVSCSEEIKIEECADAITELKNKEQYIETLKEREKESLFKQLVFYFDMVSDIYSSNIEQYLNVLSQAEFIKDDPVPEPVMSEIEVSFEFILEDAETLLASCDANQQANCEFSANQIKTNIERLRSDVAIYKKFMVDTANAYSKSSLDMFGFRQKLYDAAMETTYTDEKLPASLEKPYLNQSFPKFP